MDETKQPPVGAVTPKRLVELRELPVSEKRRKRLYWTSLGQISSETILYKTSNHGEYPLDLAWHGHFFENYFYAFAYALQTRPKL